MHLYIIRHAEPAYPADSLTPRGHLQARALALRLATLGPGALYSSPMGRAQETARYAADHLDLALGIEPWTAELETWTIAAQRAEHEPWGEAPAWEVDPRSVRGQPTDGAWHSKPPWQGSKLAVEFEALGQHSDRFLKRHGLEREGLLYRPTTEKDLPSIAVVCHCGFALTWLAHLLALPPPVLWANFTLAPASLTTLAFEEVDDETGPGVVPRCLGLGEVSHL